MSAQHVGVSHLTGWSPARYGDLDVTDGGTVGDDGLSYDIFSQAAQAVRSGGPGEGGVTGGIDIEKVLAIGASQSAGRMTAYYDEVLPLIEPVFDGYSYMVGPAPQGDRPEPVFQVLSETDAAWMPATTQDTDGFRLWEVAGTAHSGWAGREAREQRLAELYPTRGGYVADVTRTEIRNVRDGYITRADSARNRYATVRSGVGG
ncbi:hypothetical protein EKD16_23670 [Streptomonospora litoralis]|uniref:Alpha/beta hydrolase domain-containing protein n=1 Tax=Streptomonospora litoralis TaxID=2498135 RepID=A0A4P6Q7V4_9ACTN|nr:alpha/beta hydrolase domain-containing protein [Streptomonospora litoralis]QBI56480.1 hypothetical protein EKD16_23670 [Streptomonospora litoralis]